MINLNAYDVLEYNNKSWIWISRKIMYLKGIKRKKYYSFLCRFDKDNNNYDIYILLTDNNNIKKDIQIHKLFRTTREAYKVYLSGIWDKINLSFKDDKHIIDLIPEEKTDTEELYRIDFNP